MEPLSLATAFGTVIGLVADYRALRSAEDEASYEDFLGWLSETRHEELLKELKSNQKLALSIKIIMNETAQEFMARFDAIDKLLAQIASGMGYYGELAGILRPTVEVSEQAASIVRQLVESGSEKIMWVKTMDGGPDNLLLIGGNKKSVDFEDQRFLEDDLQTITEMGLVRLTYGSKGTPNYYVTRAAVAFAEGRKC